MVFDPVSVIGYVGTTAGLVGFLAATVTKLEKLNRDFHDAEKQLRWYNTKFATCWLVLKAWQRLWCDGVRSYSDEDYEYFWGKDYFEEMKEKFRLIQIEIEDIGLLLYSGFDSESESDISHQPSIEDWQRWQQRLEYLSTPRRRFHPRLSWVSKLCFASFRGANLEERTKRLKEKIDDLKELSTTAYWYTQSLDTQAVTQAKLVHLLDRKQWIDELSNSLTQLYQKCDSINDATWSLILSAPDEEGGISSVQNQTDVRIEFEVFKIIQAKCHFRSIGIVPLYGSQLKQMTIGELVEQVHGSTNLVIPNWWSQTLKELLVIDSTDFSQAFHQNGIQQRILRTTTAIRLVNWTILLWHTPWTFDACTCRIRYVFLDPQGEKWNATITTMPNSLMGLPCYDSVLGNRRALLLGVSLAELAIKKTIKVSLNSTGGPIFYIDGAVISEKELLEQVKNESCNDFKLSVRFCLVFDSRMISGCLDLRPNDIVGFKENVLDL